MFTCRELCVVPTYSKTAGTSRGATVTTVTSTGPFATGGAGIRERVESESAARAPAGGKPGAAAVRRVTVVADVVAVNTRAQTVTLRGPEHTVDLRVRDPNQLKLVKVGDQVQATFTDAVAISVEPAPSRK